MSLLHDYFNTRNLQGFQRLLDGSAERGQPAPGGPSSASHGSSYTTGGGKSWNRTEGIASAANRSGIDVNARDWLGRTPLHLSCTSLESIEYTRALLKHPQIDVNLPDVESHWTPLHKALYSANLPAALLLLQRSDIDASLKDYEGYTAFDLYNSTVDGTKPEPAAMNAELFTWGANRNAALGVGDGDDRTFPDRVNIKPKEKEDPETLSKMRISTRFSPIHVRQIQMSKLHTAIVTTEGEGNLRLCGFGSGGRLGSGQHTQYSFKPLPSFNLSIVRVALGQDHTLALTKSGEVYSWGLNRFSQLGYAVENTTAGRHEEPIQNVPKRVVGLLRREVVRGVAASKNASACWTNEAVFTWGTNTGQLGYDKNAQPVQVLPRPVTKFSGPVVELAMSDTVLVALLATRQVECIWNDRQYRINFSLQAFPTGIQPYRPPQSINDSRISKVTCCDDTFAALSSSGEVFTFAAPASTDTSANEGRGPIFKPQRVWTLRKKFSAVKDVALGSDGSIIICTESGHVFVRTRNAKSSSGKAFKFERVPYLQRVTQVCANSTGAFGALRIDYVPKAIQVTGTTIAEDLKTVQPYLKFYHAPDESDSENDKVARPHANSSGRRPRSATLTSSLHFDDEPEDETIEDDIDSILELCDVLAVEQRMRKRDGGSINYDGVLLPHGADTMIHVQSGAVFPAHRVILAARSQAFETLLSGSKAFIDQKSSFSLKLMPAKPGPGLGVFKLTRLSISGCHPLAVLIFLSYLYSDTLVAVWDRRVAVSVEKELALSNANPAQIKADLQALARVLELPLLAAALEPPVKREPAPSMAQDMQRLFDAVQKGSLSKLSPLAPDVVLQLADKDVYTHSVILRARTSLFASFFDLEDWTIKRWASDGSIRIDLKHLTWHVMKFVLGFMCCGQDAEMFHVLDFIHSLDELLRFMFDVLAGANELLLDRLVLLCSSVILTYINIHNACFVLAEATYYHAHSLVEKLQEYISINMETFLEGRILDEISYALVKQLAKFTRLRQTEKSPFARSDEFLKEMLKKHADWLELQDFPETIVKLVSKGPLKKDNSWTKISPTLSAKASFPKMSPTNSPKITPPGLSSLPVPPGDDIFMMDDPEQPLPSACPEATAPPPVVAPPRPVWKAHGAPRIDMKTVMAEAAIQQASSSRQLPAPSIQTPPRIIDVTKGPSSTIGMSSSPSTKPSVKAGASAPWRTPANSTAAGGTPSTPPRTPNTLSGPSLPSTSGRSPASNSPTAGRLQSPGTPTRASVPGLGPMITPTRLAPSKTGASNIRVPSNSTKSWVLPPHQTAAAPSPPPTGMSFIAIQHSQREQLAPIKDKRSLREIQEEEQSLQLEADFLKWWTAEEERVQQEALALAQIQSNLGKQAPRQPRLSKRKSNTGKDKEKSETTSADIPRMSTAQNSDRSGQQKPPRRRPKKPDQKNTTDS
ncbi:hypothetical protein NLJ89_g1583 [Agrocybe chaxingu]|uniref:BTB domain-containing protein n=1 Tax=Agrocybe chaxingu TaxID=84603 RepID=A0A9W8MZR1_9AGAR|nr:hypothetical protein NLJ89_g1583 [Agrocybe chaxingu]